MRVGMVPHPPMIGKIDVSHRVTVGVEFARLRVASISSRFRVQLRVRRIDVGDRHSVFGPRQRPIREGAAVAHQDRRHTGVVGVDTVDLQVLLIRPQLCDDQKLPIIIENPVPRV